MFFYNFILSRYKIRNSKSVSKKNSGSYLYRNLMLMKLYCILLIVVNMMSKGMRLDNQNVCLYTGS